MNKNDEGYVYKAATCENSEMSCVVTSELQKCVICVVLHLVD